MPAPRVAVEPAGAEELADLDLLKDGPRRLLELLHRLGRDVVKARAYRVTPSQTVLHSAQELLAAALGCHVVTVWRWLAPLKDAGLVDARAHFTSSRTKDGRTVTRADGTLFAVTLKRGHRARLRHDDLAYQYRDLDADRAAGRTAWKVLQGSEQRQQAEWYFLLRNWAVIPGSTSHPLASDPCMGAGEGPHSVQDVAYTLPLLAEAHSTKRAALVGLMGAALARALHDQHSRRYWCRVIWDAWTAEVEGHAGLQVLAAALCRLAADLAEGAPWRNPGAILAARLRPAI